jgi:hypothetical protein
VARFKFQNSVIASHKVTDSDPARWLGSRPERSDPARSCRIALSSRDPVGFYRTLPPSDRSHRVAHVSPEARAGSVGRQDVSQDDLNQILFLPLVYVNTVYYGCELTLKNLYIFLRLVNYYYVEFIMRRSTRSTRQQCGRIELQAEF